MNISGGYKMQLRDLILANRSYRRFKEEKAVGCDTLKELVDLGRLSASGGNLQPLKYIISCDHKKNALIFSQLAWAGYLKNWPGPAEGERPAAYIIILCDADIAKSPGCDHGIAAQSIMLGAVEKGLGGCIIGSVNRDELRRALDIPGRYDILLVLALGYPAEEVVLETADEDGDIKYWRDDKGVHHVPKRGLKDVIMTEVVAAQ
jgi:nitroreductase